MVVWEYDMRPVKMQPGESYTPECAALSRNTTEKSAMSMCVHTGDSDLGAPAQWVAERDSKHEMPFVWTEKDGNLISVGAVLIFQQACRLPPIIWIIVYSQLLISILAGFLGFEAVLMVGLRIIVVPFLSQRIVSGNVILVLRQVNLISVGLVWNYFLFCICFIEDSNLYTAKFSFVITTDNWLVWDLVWIC